MSTAAPVTGGLLRTPSVAGRRVDSVVLIALLLVAWQAASWLVGPTVLPSPWRTFQQLGREVRDPDFLGNVAATGAAFGMALLLSVVGGVVIGLALGAHRLSGDVAEPMLFALYSIPKIALYPVILLAFGLGISAKVAFGAIHGIIPVALFAMTAVRNIPRVYLRSARVHRLTPVQAALHVLIPAAVPEIVSGLRIGFSLTLLGTLLGEMFASQWGIGHLLMLAMDRNEPPTIMALAVLLFLFATLGSLALLQWDRRVRHEV